MRVDTGFLRASQAYKIGSLPEGPTRGDKGKKYSGPVGDGPEVLLDWEPGDTTFVGWTAGYARIREYKDGFLRLAVQKWKKIVAKNVALARRAGL